MRSLLRIACLVLLAVGGPRSLAAQSDIRSEPFPKEKPRELSIGFKKPENGIVEVEADEQDWVRDVSWVGIGNVSVRYGALRIQAGRIRVDLVSTDVDADEGVVIDDGPNRIVARRLHYNLTTRRGLFEEASLDLDPDYHFTGRVVEKTGASDYVFEDGIFTSCDVPDPAWSFRVARGELTIGGYATLHNTSFRIAGAPVLFLPWVVWPARRERTSGWLVPNIGYSSDRGAGLGMAYYRVLGPAADATVYLDGYSEGFAGLGLEYRQAFEKGGTAEVLGYGLWDSEANELEWKGKLRIRNQNIPGGFRLLVEALAYSDPEFFRLFERVPSLTTLRTVAQTGALSTDRGPFTLNLRAERRETLFDRYTGESTVRQSVVQMRLPGFELRSRPIRIGSTPFYAAVTGSADSLSDRRGEELVDGPEAALAASRESSWLRADAWPRLSAGLRLFPWLSISPEVSLRETWYSKSTDLFAPPGEVSGDAVERRIFVGQATMVGPSFARVFDAKLGRWTRLKHIIEPRLEYRRTQFVGEVEDNSTIPYFDEVDSELGLSGEERTTFSLVNRVLGKDPSRGSSAREIASLKLSRTWWKREVTGEGSSTSTSVTGPLMLDVRVNPPGGIYASGTIAYETSDSAGRSGVTSTSLTTGWTASESLVSLSWSGRHSLVPGAEQTGQIQLATRTPIIPKRLILDARIVHSLTGSPFPVQRYLVEYRGSCWSVFAEYRDTDYGLERRRDFRVSFNLRDVGTFIDVSGGLDRLPF